MGVGSSLQNSAKNYEPPPLPPPFYTGGYLSGTPRVSSIEKSSQAAPADEPRIRASLRNEEYWQQRPSVPSLSNLRQPQETLLTYAAQMTGWQSEYTPSAPSVHQEAMELTRTVSHLAAANHQLASAHNALLAQLERLYMELNRERDKKASLADISNQSEGDNDLIRRIEAIESIIQGELHNSTKAKNRSPEEKIHKSFSQKRGKHLDEKKDLENRKQEYQKVLERIQILENELEPPGKSDVGFNEPETSQDKNRVLDLLKEISRLKTDQLETQEVNKKLAGELEKQKKLMERLRRDYEVSKNHCEIVESHLSAREEELEQLKKDFDIAKSETLKVTKELDAFHEEKDTTTARIKDLERDLQKAELARNETITLAGEESWKLRSRLQEEIKNKNKQNEAFEESLREIQRLNEIIEGIKKERKCDERVSTSTDVDGALDRPGLEEFKKDLSMKREARQRAIAAVSSEMDRLRRELDAEKEAHSETSRVLDLLKSQAENASRKSETFSVGTTTSNSDNWRIQSEWQEQNPVHLDVQRLTDVLKVSDELRACIRVQIEKIDDLRYHLECDPETNASRIEKLKEIANTNREVFRTREQQINSLKNILSTSVARLGDDQFHMDVVEDLRTEHNCQLDDIRQLKNLYDERLRVLAELKDTCNKELINVKDVLKSILKEKEILDEDYAKAEEKIDLQQTEIANLESQLGLTKADCRDLQNQMSLINGLFSQMLLSASSADMDLDRLTQLLQENHDLISEMAREEGTEAAALPKLLLDLVEQVEGREKTKSDGDSEKKEEDQQEENIANNLPKVWRVLLELLSCHAAQGSTSTSSNLLSTDPNVCYKSVDTPAGPRLVISVSKTYIRLKELILEKKHLEKEMGRLKQLNSHLESKLGEQEKRLSTISDELSKTWSIVGRMQAQHQQLHTHEKILRYELQQKRIMLQELKQELEYCREKWESARQKNTNTEMEWRNLRREFAARKMLAVDDSFNNSAESGFSDERGDDTDEDDIPNEERLRIGPRRRTRKESPRTPTPDTESDHPTDNESSESKAVSTTSDASSSEQRTSTPDITHNAQLIVIEEDIPEQRVEDFDPLDRALANVIQNLIDADGTNGNRNERTSLNSDVEEPLDNSQGENNLFKIEPLGANNTVSVFSIGPFPTIPSTTTLNNESDNHAEKSEETANIRIPTIVVNEETKSNEIENTKSSTEAMTDINTVLKENKEEARTEKASELPSTSTSNSSKPSRSPEEVLAARAARLKRLEEQADWLMKKMNATSQRGSALSTRLEELHEVYGEPPAPPPLPDVLPSVRLPTDLNTIQEGETSQKDSEKKL
ncbi:cingulin-like protein 1 isoform X2 [Chelonus insularis]|uniref:cingulin-like protein 1 isoform X2 n=1 Tax=Chelonus insularis TaxID=460826 RepID=UPI001588DE76|nr:cingulin-like protein 1 isoform X2 [Chelonus insularis]